MSHVQLIINPRNAEAKDLSINNPLSQEVEVSCLSGVHELNTDVNKWLQTFIMASKFESLYLNIFNEDLERLQLYSLKPYQEPRYNESVFLVIYFL